MPFARINKITTWYEDTGPNQGLPIIFANSLGTDHRIWDDVTRALSPRRRCIVYDKRGHGLSDVSEAPYAIADLASDLLALADICGIERFAICGVSVGGMIALAAAAAAPERIAALMLCDTAHQIGTAEMWDARIEQVENQGLAAMADGILERWLSPAYRQSRQDELAGWRNLLCRTPSSGYISTCAAIRDADLGKAAAAVSVPALVLAGEADLATPPELVSTLADRIPDARFILIPDVGHIPSIEQPELLAGLLGDFLETLPHE